MKMIDTCSYVEAYCIAPNYSYCVRSTSALIVSGSLQGVAVVLKERVLFSKVKFSVYTSTKQN